MIVQIKNPLYSEYNGCRLYMAEDKGFEPSEACASPTFQAGAIGHSTNPP